MRRGTGSQDDANTARKIKQMQNENDSKLMHKIRVCDSFALRTQVRNALSLKNYIFRVNFIYKRRQNGHREKA